MKSSLFPLNPILLDLIMPNISGDELLSMIADDFPDIPVIIITGNNKVDMAVQCMKTGTFDYMLKPIEKNRLISGVKRAIEIRGLQDENRLLKEHILSGELKSPDAFSDTLFGHINGAFTGADKARKGMVENAFGGTLLLDEIGDLSPDSQVKLLRLLQEREYFPLGADLPKIADVKIIVATNRDLSALQESGRFRKDLYYRICSHHLDVPPLRERLEDLPLLVNHFIEKAAREFDKKIPSWPLELITLLSNYHFPGNIRELKSMIYDAVAGHKSKIMSLGRFEAYIKKNSSVDGIVPEQSFTRQDSGFLSFKSIPTLEQVTHLLFAEAMKRTGNNKTMAARLLGISRQRLGRYLKNASE